MKSKSAKSLANLLQSLQSAIETLTLLLESLGGIFFFIVVIFAKDTRSMREFDTMPGLDTVLLKHCNQRFLKLELQQIKN